MNKIPSLVTNNKKINDAYRLAIATLSANILPFKDGILEKEENVIIAGLGYETPWTRDAAINTWNAGGIICPDVALNTLKSVLGKNDKGYFIDGEYWDKIIWTTGAWNYYLYTGDNKFLKMAYEATCNSLEYLEETEFTQELNLFRGGACFQDGVAGYPDVYAKHGESGIIIFTTECRDLCADTGVGLPMYALSTNCLYYNAYVLADKMADELGFSKKFEQKAEKIKEAINSIFWNEQKKNYNYLYDKFGGCDSVEGLGIAFAILFDVASKEQSNQILLNTPVSAHGIPCVSPNFKRYETEDGMGFGRHSGTVWPHVQGFWADAVSKYGNKELFDDEFSKQFENALRYYQFAEIYHPITGEMYGGRQERRKGGITEWNSEPFQTWSATAYLRNVFFNLCGLNFTTEGINFKPIGSSLTKKIELKNLTYRNAIINISIVGNGNKISTFKINGEEAKPFISSDIKGEVNIDIELEA